MIFSDMQDGVAALSGAMFAVIEVVAADANRHWVPAGVEFLAVAPERVRLLAVLGVVTDQQVLLGHAQRRNHTDGKHDERGGHDVPAYDEQRADDLLHHLHTALAAVEQPVGVRHR